ncbi:cell surface protein [Bifidobacterium sp. LC6]|uniref:Cell surface protein n=1 Tax=Bifidobacterium colobi TaxID=2809026 RepID=A0ABS5UT53_9BIFI|nr:cell surface protein [Bifidobacterium colobi]MBT1174020.1 cell surface protein [Bifidobacterium colobi]
MKTSWLRKRMMAIGAMAVGMALMLGVLVGLPVTAQAASLTQAPSNTYVLYHHGGQQYAVGMAGISPDGSQFYCIEAGILTDYEIGPIEIVKNEYAARVAWLLDKYRSASTLDHAAVAVVVQDKYGAASWGSHRKVIESTRADIIARAAEIWAEAERHAPANATVERTYAEGLRQGEVKVAVTNGAQQPIAGVPFTVTLEGPAVFAANGKASISDTSQSSAKSFTWKATGRGTVKATTSYDSGQLKRMIGLQDMMAFDSMSATPGEAVNFKVRKDFTPSVSTVASDKVLDAGSQVFDEVTSGVADADSHWVPNMLLEAQGYYFDGLAKEDLGKMLAPGTGQSADDYIANIEGDGYKPSAYGSVSFTGPNQHARVQAMTKPDGSKPYVTPSSGGFGTWVWVFRKTHQSKEAQEYLVGDWSSTFLETAESNSNRSKLEVESTVTEHSAAVGAELSDTITISGFPEDHGSFTGNKDYGFGADRPHAQVSVWWAGDPFDASKDEAYKPAGAEVPQEDEHHKLLVTWDIPAKNGTFKVGSGIPDANGDPMNLVAEQHGWYVFVWEFKGDDRVMPAASRYDDAWERTRVRECEEECEEPCEEEEPEPEEESEEPEPLSHTGSSAIPMAGIAASALTVGLIVLVIARKRRMEQ